MRVFLERPVVLEFCVPRMPALRRAGSALVLGMLIAAVLLLVFNPVALRADSSTNGNRFLFVVDSSSAMKSKRGEIIDLVAGIIDSGASRQLRHGDTLGLWTFDKDVYSDLPLQTWDVESRADIATRTTNFLKGQIFSGSARYDRLLATLLPVIHASDVITVVIVSDGKGKLKGTPFDREINELCANCIKDSKTHSPIVVTVLQGRGGKVFEYTVNALPWPVIIPEVPISKVPAASPIAAQPPASHTKPASGPPLIVPKPAPAAVASTPVVPLAANTAAAPGVSSGPLQTVVPIYQPPPLPPPPGGPPPTIINDPSLPPPALVPPQMIPRPPPAMKETLPVKASAPRPPTEEKAPPLIFTMDPKRPPVTNEEVAPVPPAPKPIAKPAPVEAAPLEAPLAVTTSSIPSRPKILLIAAVILAVTGGVLIFLMVLRGRETPGPSLITRSMNDRRD